LWQVEQDTVPSRLMPASKKSVEPSAAAAGASAYWFVVSGFKDGSVFSASDAMVFFSASLNCGSPQPPIKPRAAKAMHATLVGRLIARSQHDVEDDGIGTRRR
jgi:hypothetical protein